MGIKPGKDTIVVAADKDTFKETYIGKIGCDGCGCGDTCWGDINLSEKARKQLKYLAIYVKLPEANISDYAEICDFKESKQAPGKYVICLKNQKKLQHPIKYKGKSSDVPTDVPTDVPRGRCYTSLKKLLTPNQSIGNLWK